MGHDGILFCNLDIMIYNINITRNGIVNYYPYGGVLSHKDSACNFPRSRPSSPHICEVGDGPLPDMVNRTAWQLRFQKSKLKVHAY